MLSELKRDIVKLKFCVLIAVFMFAILFCIRAAFADDLVEVQGDFQTPVINQLCAMPQPTHGLAYVWINGVCTPVIR